MNTPKPEELLDYAHVDREQAYLLFATFCGQPVPVAKALGISPAAVLRMAAEGGWGEKLKPILELHQGAAKPADIERAVNRALNFAQGHRLRAIIERLLRRFYHMSPEDLLEEYAEEGGKGCAAQKAARGLADLASALEKAHAATYMALNDTATERRLRGPETDGASASALQAQISAALDNVLADNSPRAQLFDAQLALAKRA